MPTYVDDGADRDDEVGLVKKTEPRQRELKSLSDLHTIERRLCVPFCDLGLALGDLVQITKLSARIFSSRTFPWLIID